MGDCALVKMMFAGAILAMLFFACDTEIQGEKEDYQWGNDFGDEEDAGVVGGMIVIESDLANVAYCVAEEPNGIGGGCGEPEVSA